MHANALRRRLLVPIASHRQVPGTAPCSLERLWQLSIAVVVACCSPRVPRADDRTETRSSSKENGTKWQAFGCRLMSRPSALLLTFSQTPSVLNIMALVSTLQTLKSHGYSSEVVSICWASLGCGHYSFGAEGFVFFILYQLCGANIKFFPLALRVLRSNRYGS